MKRVVFITVLVAVFDIGTNNFRCVGAVDCSGPTSTYQTAAGQQTRLLCRTDQSDHEWSFQRSPAVLSISIIQKGNPVNGYSKQYRIERQSDGFALVILNATADDAGTYWCTEDRGLGNHQCMQLEVTGSVGDTSTSSSKLIVAVSEKPGVLPCISHTPVDWRFRPDNQDNVITIGENGHITPQHIKKYSITSGQTEYYNLTIHQTEPKDAGTYICIEDGGIGQEHTVVLDVIKPRTSQTVLAGSPVEFICRQSDAIRWTHKNNDLQEVLLYNGYALRDTSGRMQVFNGVSGNYSVLRLSGVRISDAGTYACSLTSAAPDRVGLQRQFDLTVLDVKPSCTIYPDNARLTAGQSFIVQCLVNYVGNIDPVLRCQNINNSVSRLRLSTMTVLTAMMSAQCDHDDTLITCLVTFGDDQADRYIHEFTPITRLKVTGCGETVHTTQFIMSTQNVLIISILIVTGLLLTLVIAAIVIFIMRHIFRKRGLKDLNNKEKGPATEHQQATILKTPAENEITNLLASPQTSSPTEEDPRDTLGTGINNDEVKLQESGFESIKGSRDSNKRFYKTDVKE